MCTDIYIYIVLYFNLVLIYIFLIFQELEMAGSYQQLHF